ncbi:MAG: thioredoxin family protein, partial [Thermodesulfovibrionales bacterium]|jgi:thioredoxin-related protein
MKYLSVLIVGIFLTLSSLAVASDGVKWLSLKEGMEKAKIEKKPMIVDFFFGKGCPRCEKLQANVYENPSIARKIMDDFVPIMVDLTKKKLTKEEEALGNKYDFKNDCLLLFLDPEGNIVKDPGGKRLCFVDYVEPNVFIQYLDMVKGRLSN